MVVLKLVLPSVALVCVFVSTGLAQPLPNAKRDNLPDYFRQLEEWLPTPNSYRTGAGAPGPSYWQQRADYQIDVTLDDTQQRLSGSLRMTYHNLSPHPLQYIWMQLDQNIFRPGSDAVMTAVAPSLDGRVSFHAMKTLLAREKFPGGYDITRVADESGNVLPSTIVKTMMRVDLPQTLAPGKSTVIEVDFAFNIVDAKLIRARGGYEYFEADDNYIYEIAQWFPRAVAYTDYTGWQHKQFLGSGEFTLDFGDYLVRITAPADHVVTATGELTNAKDVLTKKQRARLKSARGAAEPIFVITPEEAKANEGSRSESTKTWVFEAKNVRDFAFASSRKFIWDAMTHQSGDQQVLAMSLYPNEGEPLWSKYSTHSIVHTLEVYSRYTFDYPYPVAISVNGPVHGMEYPMICFNGPRPEPDGTYSAQTKYGLISVVIHEVGHNYFPMIVNSDERQWMWMDEGLNTFLQYLAEQEWEEGYPSRRGEPADIVAYMRSGNQMPVMTSADSVLQLGSNAYAKPATALNILRETILGRELFDFAFREFARRWKFRRPTPADFFRTMEDASGVDLDWFWRGWFYSTDHVDIGIDSVRLYVIDSGDPDQASERKRIEQQQRKPSLSSERNADLPKRVDAYPSLKDFYNDFDRLQVTEESRKAFQRFVDSLDEHEKALIQRKTHFYVVQFHNHGGVVMPIILDVHYTDGSSETKHFPAQIWRTNGKNIKKLIITDKEIQRLELDPRQQIADADPSNNHWPAKLVPSRFQLYKQSKSRNEMQKAEAASAAAESDPEPGDGDSQADGKEDQQKKQGKNKRPR